MTKMGVGKIGITHPIRKAFEALFIDCVRDGL